MYTYDETFQASVDYFNGDELAARVFVDKYALRDNGDNLLEKTPKDMFKRIAKELYSAEKVKYSGEDIETIDEFTYNCDRPLSEKLIESLLDEFKYIVMQGSPMYGLGNPYQYVTVGNCYVIPQPRDSYLGIMYTDTQITQITCRRGGVGWDNSKLRPKNTPVKNAAKTTSGMVSFAERFSNTIREVGQHGRRGASLQSLLVKHPDIFEFISVKLDKTKMTGSNISVKFTDEFMNAVEENDDFELCWPVCDADRQEMRIPEYHCIRNTVKAKDIWDKFIDSTWSMAEPGAMFVDTVLRESTSAPYPGFEEVSSNPCVAKGTLVNTPYGYRKVEDISVGDTVSTILGSEKVETIEVNRNYEVFKVKFSDGGEQIVTAGHIYHATRKGSGSKKIEEIKVSELKVGDYVRVYPGKINRPNESSEVYVNAFKVGVILGDGSYTDNYISKKILKISSNQDDLQYNDNIIKLFGNENFINYDNSKKSKSTNLIFDISCLDNCYNLFGVEPSYCENKKINITKVKTFNEAIGLLDGMLATDGNVNLKSNHPQIRWSTSSKELASQIRELLLLVGCHGIITNSFKQDGGTINGRKIVRKNRRYVISISGDSLLNYAENTSIDLYHPEKGKKIKEAQINFRLTGNSWNPSVISIEKLADKYDVYDLYCKNSDTWITSGYVQRGCGEQNLPAYGCCRLLLQNLFSYVRNKFTENAYFDYELFGKHAMILQRLGDDLVDIDIRYMNRIIDKIKSDPEPDEIKQPAIDMWNKIIATAIGDRRTGCGFTALGDALASLGIKYGSEESIEFCDKMQKAFKQAAYKSSVGMAKVLGSFPVFDTELDNKSAFIQRLKEDSFEIWKEMQVFGRRNMTLLTIAPTGSVSCLTRTTSGLEPVFKLSYMRRKKGNPNEKDFRTDFIDQNGDHWMNFEVHHHGLSEFFRITGKTKIEDSPYYNATANDIDWINRIRMQAALQKHIDNSISLTVNLPENIDKETVSKIYFTAWELGCKGCTIYRENCRTGVLLALDKATESAKITNNAKKRPESLDCDIYHISVKGKEFFCLIGMMDNQPYEVLAGENGCISKKAKKGKITKVKRGQYKLEADTGEVLESVTELSENDEEAITRLVSTSLRHHVDIAYIVHQLEKTKGGLQNFAKCISRVLKKYVKNGTKVSGEECKECGGELVRVEGCLSCNSCGYSKCS